MQAELQQTTAPVGRAGVLRLVELKRGALCAEGQMMLEEESGEASLYVGVVRLPCWGGDGEAQQGRLDR